MKTVSFRRALLGLVVVSAVCAGVGSSVQASTNRIQGYLLRAEVEAQYHVDARPVVAGSEDPAIEDSTVETLPGLPTTTQPTAAPSITQPAPALPTTTTTVEVPEAPIDAFPWVMSAPSIGLNADIRGGENSNAVVDTGDIWHWTGTGTPAGFNHIVTFAHRTSKGGTFRDIHNLADGDIITVTGPTGTVWQYKVAGRNVVSPEASNIYAEARAYGGPSISLVACSKADGTPTSLSYRLVVTAVRI